MRLLADENLPRPVVQFLRNLGHDIVWARTDLPGLKDNLLFECAETNRRVLLTLDKDVWQLAVTRPLLLKRAGVILFRAFPATPEILPPVVAATLPH